jgi:outer membrane protein OmpA-like peptidoglycan-associated protein
MTTMIVSCSTHYFLEGNTLNDQGAYMEAAEQYERALVGRYDTAAYESLVPIYLELNRHDRALECLDSLEAIKGLSTDQKFSRAETLMSLGRYSEAQEAYSELEPSIKVNSRLKSLSTLDARQSDSIYYKVREINIQNNSLSSTVIASAALPHRVGDELYFVVETERKFTQRKKEETFIDDYTGNRLMDLWKGTIVDTSGFDGKIDLLATPLIEINTQFHDGVVAHLRGDTVGVLDKTYIRPKESFKQILLRPAGERILRPMQLFEAILTTDSVGDKFWETQDRLSFCDENYLFAHPALSPDGNTLFFTSNMPDGHGGMDIWKVVKIEGSWSAPENLGDVVNTQGDEAFPTMRHPDTLYFSSDGHMGLGGLDIVFATRSNTDSFTEIFENYPSPINSSRDDFGVQLDPKGFGGIFASDRTGIDGLYHFSSFSPDITLYVETVHEADLSPWPDILTELEILTADTSIIFISDSNGKWSTSISRGEEYLILCPASYGYKAETFTAPEDQTITSITKIIPIPKLIEGCKDPVALNYQPDAFIDDGSCLYKLLGCMDITANNYNPLATIDDGSCEFDIPGCMDITSDNYNPLATIDDGSCEFDIPGCMNINSDNYNPLATIDDGSCEIPIPIIPGDIVEGNQIKLDIHWDFDKAKVRAEDLVELSMFADSLLAKASLRVLLTSHCDTRATYKYNDNLSQARATAVKQALIDLGVSSDRLVSFGAGEQLPLIDCGDNCDEDSHQINRRTIATILLPNEKPIVHIVKSDDTLYSLSIEHKVSIVDIQKWNGLTSEGIRRGQDLLIYLP